MSFPCFFHVIFRCLVIIYLLCNYRNVKDKTICLKWFYINVTAQCNSRLENTDEIKLERRNDQLMRVLVSGLPYREIS